MYNKSVFYVLLMCIFGVLSYLFFDSYFNTKTVVKVNYENNSDVYYKVKYLDNNYTNNGDKYISSMVDYIEIDYEYNNILSEYISGYYKYSVDSYLIAYEDNINNSLWERKYKLVNENVILIDQNNVNNIKINGNFKLNYKQYREEILKFINDYNIDISGYLHIRINVLEFLNFNKLEKEYADNKVITIDVPLTDEIFNVKVNNIKNRDSYYEFSNKVSMNVVFLIIGLFCFSMSLTFMIMIIRQFVLIYKRESEYNKKLKRLLHKYDNIIVRVNKIYVSKKYNMIYVNNFNELLDVYNNTGKIINFKEVRRGIETIFLIIDDDNAWIYKLS